MTVLLFPGLQGVGIARPYCNAASAHRGTMKVLLFIELEFVGIAWALILKLKEDI